MLFDQNPRWCAALSNAIPEAIFQPCPRPPTQNVARVIKIPRSFRKKLNDSAFTKNTRSIATAPDLTTLTNSNLRMKVPDWRLWAYTDGSCLTNKSQQRVGAGVFIIRDKQYHKQSRTDWHSFCTKGKVSSECCKALPVWYGTHIATDSACSLSQMRKQLLFPELHRKHTHCKLLEQIVSMINESDTPIIFYKVEAHIGVIGNFPFH